MNSFQESKQELEAAIRYAENAISSANATIESMEFRQEIAKKQHFKQTEREEVLTKQVRELESKLQGQYDDIVRLQREVEHYTKEYNYLLKQKEASSAPCGCQAYRNLEEQLAAAGGSVHYHVNREAELQNRIEELESEVDDLKIELKDQRDFDEDVRQAVNDFLDFLDAIGYERA